MSVISFNIGLSLLSRNLKNQKVKTRHETALAILSFFEGREVTDNDITREEGGRPFFSENREQRDFNITHSGDIVAVSYVRGSVEQDSILRTGCDVQIVKERANTLRIAEQFFSPTENKYILTQKEQGNNSSFFEIWTLKECYVKLHGLSVFDMISAPDFVNEDGNLNLTTDNTSFFLFKLNDCNEEQYILAAAVNGIALTPSVQWL